MTFTGVHGPPPPKLWRSYEVDDGFEVLTDAQLIAAAEHPRDLDDIVSLHTGTRPKRREERAEEALFAAYARATGVAEVPASAPPTDTELAQLERGLRRAEAVDRAGREFAEAEEARGRQREARELAECDRLWPAFAAMTGIR